LDSEEERKVAHIEDTSLLGKADFFSEFVPDVATKRKIWFSALSKKANGCCFIFLDPDNGLEIKSKPYGRKDSSKFLYWREVEELWQNGKSLLICVYRRSRPPKPVEAGHPVEAVNPAGLGLLCWVFFDGQC